MRTGVFYLNNSGSRWVALTNGKKDTITLKTKSGVNITRTAIEYSSFGNFSAVKINYKGKRMSILTDSVLND